LAITDLHWKGRASQPDNLHQKAKTRQPALANEKRVKKKQLTKDEPSPYSAQEKS